MKQDPTTAEELQIIWISKKKSISKELKAEIAKMMEPYAADGITYKTTIKNIEWNQSNMGSVDIETNANTWAKLVEEYAVLFLDDLNPVALEALSGLRWGFNIPVFSPVIVDKKFVRFAFVNFEYMRQQAPVQENEKEPEKEIYMPSKKIIV